VTATNRLPERIRQLLRCPICTSTLSLTSETVEQDMFRQPDREVGSTGRDPQADSGPAFDLVCDREGCPGVFPVLGGTPVLINESASVFRLEDFRKQQSTTFNLARIGRRNILRRLWEYIPPLGENLIADRNYGRFAETLAAAKKRPRVLVVGCGVTEDGLNKHFAGRDFELVETDVSFGPRTQLVCDAHDLPFADASFDGVVVQAVLEHVLDPVRCVEQIHRVTVDGGLVYAETPFMQQVHMGRYDFTRFTNLGHRRLFRRYRKIETGPVAGPGMALAWSHYYFALSFCRSHLARAAVRRLTAWATCWLKYLDRYLIDKPGTYDAAPGFYFMGRKEDGYCLSDKELLQDYIGMHGTAS